MRQSLFPVFIVAVAVGFPRAAGADVNGDGTVNQTDLNLLTGHVTQSAVLNGANLNRADVNGDGIIDAADVNRIANQLAPPVTIQLPGGVPLVLVSVPAGSFPMGSPNAERSRESDELPVHTVNIGYDFYLGRNEVTQQQWLAVMGSWPAAGPTSELGAGTNYPAYYVSWDDARNFCTAVNQHINATSQDVPQLRLPSEAEWEYACRAGTQTRYYFGDSLNVLDDCSTDSERNANLWFCGNNAAQGQSGYGSKQVGRKAPNALGLYDMHGNVWEWTADTVHSNYNGAPTDGSAWFNASIGARIIRGGFWGADARHARSGNRGQDTATDRTFIIGFRVAGVR